MACGWRYVTMTLHGRLWHFADTVIDVCHWHLVTHQTQVTHWHLQAHNHSCPLHAPSLLFPLPTCTPLTHNAPKADSSSCTFSILHTFVCIYTYFNLFLSDHELMSILTCSFSFLLRLRQHHIVFWHWLLTRYSFFNITSVSFHE